MGIMLYIASCSGAAKIYVTIARKIWTDIGAMPG